MALVGEAEGVSEVTRKLTVGSLFAGIGGIERHPSARERKGVR